MDSWRQQQEQEEQQMFLADLAAARKDNGLCPQCGCGDIANYHKDGSVSLCETYWKECMDCGYQFDIE